MRIRSIHFDQVGPLGRSEPYACKLEDSWRGGLHDMILLSGPNGCGKTTVLRAVAHLWALTGSWLAAQGRRGKSRHSSWRWLSRWGGVAVILDDVPLAGSLGLFIGDDAFFEHLDERYPNLFWISEGRPRIKGQSTEHLKIHTTSWLPDLSDLYKRLILTNASSMPNMIHLDGEERRWVAPTKGLGEVVADDPQMKWLVGYRANEDWKGQLEASLIAMKTLDEGKYFRVLEDLNSFLKPKQIDPQPDSNTLRLRVFVPGGDSRTEHTLDDLSAGEHQVLIQLYLVSRWLNEGGIVMIDEPDLHLHPSLLNGFLSRLEVLVSERNGQLFLTSHNPELWQRYENKGLRIQLGGEP